VCGVFSHQKNKIWGKTKFIGGDEEGGDEEGGDEEGGDEEGGDEEGGDVGKTRL
jgi:hypothetical protein